MQTLEAILAQHPFFNGLQAEYVQVVTGCASNVRYPAGAYLFHEGEEASNFYVIRQGKVALEIGAAAGGLIVIETIEAGEVLGWSWLFPPYRWHFSARVVQPTRAFTLDGKCLLNKSAQDHNLGYELLMRFAQIIIERLEATRLQLLDVYGLPPPGRVRNTL